MKLDSSIGFLISDTARHVKRLLYPGIAQLGIRGGSWYALRALFEEDGVTQRELATRLGTTQPSTLEMLRSMETEGLVHFQRDTIDRRKLRIHLTEKALLLKPQLLSIASDSNAILVGGLTQAQQTMLRALLCAVRRAAAGAIAQSALQSAVEASPAALNLRDEESHAAETRRIPGAKRGPRSEAPGTSAPIRKRKA